MVVFLLGQSLRVVVVLCTYITNSETQAVQLFVRGLFINNPSLLHIVTIISNCKNNVGINRNLLL